MKISYEWNWKRKIWHTGGCAFILALYLLWQEAGTRMEVLVVAGAAALWISLMELCRFYRPQDNEAYIKRFKGIMREIEYHSFDGTFYYVWGTFLLIALTDSTPIVVMSLLVLGLADPAAAYVRWKLTSKGKQQVLFAGLFAFGLVSALVITAMGYMTGDPYSVLETFMISSVVAAVETFTKYVVIWVRPITHKIQQVIRYQWFCRFYPDDNLTILVATVLATKGVLRFV